jgi:hypothetical protein
MTSFRIIEEVGPWNEMVLVLGSVYVLGASAAVDLHEILAVVLPSRRVGH